MEFIIHVFYAVEVCCLLFFLFTFIITISCVTYSSPKDNENHQVYNYGE